MFILRLIVHFLLNYQLEELQHTSFYLNFIPMVEHRKIQKKPKIEHLNRNSEMVLYLLILLYS
jgi:hypothetical protein